MAARTDFCKVFVRLWERKSDTIEGQMYQPGYTLGRKTKYISSKKMMSIQIEYHFHNIFLWQLLVKI
jgi:hypothetical protein